MPIEAELEKFLADAEKEFQKQFAEKYVHAHSLLKTQNFFSVVTNSQQPNGNLKLKKKISFCFTLFRYNYDIVKDEPLEGRYEWVRLRP